MPFILVLSYVLVKATCFAGGLLLKDKQATRTAVLLFTENIIPHHISATITCSLFYGHDKLTILDSKHYEGDFYSNYINAMNYIISHIDTEFVITKDHRKELPELPIDALREALLNAIAHRDYQSAANIQVGIFKDRIEISNPGSLPGHMTLEEFGTKSLARNPLLFSMLHRKDLVEKIGSGVLRMKSMMEKQSLKAPKYDITKSFFTITFYRDVTKIPRDEKNIQNTNDSSKKTSGKTSGKILALMKNSPQISIPEIAELLGKTTRAIEMQIANLKKQGALQRIGSAKGGYWEVIE